ncbi:MAG TPA: hypothetical protein VMA71_02770 [Alloacidobacterium sp.]|nr:hypothetical protein [Alloacidobacterium sp.]
MTRETTNRGVQEMYPESDAATKRELEGLANSISQFRAAVHHIAGQQKEPAQAAWQMDLARERRRNAQRRILLEWAVAATAAMVLGIAALGPAVGSYRNHEAQLRAQHQEQILKQREADTALLDQVANELSVAVPDSMQPLAEMDADYASYQTTGKTEKKNGRN